MDHGRSYLLIITCLVMLFVSVCLLLKAKYCIKRYGIKFRRGTIESIPTPPQEVLVDFLTQEQLSNLDAVLLLRKTGLTGKMQDGEEEGLFRMRDGSFYYYFDYRRDMHSYELHHFESISAQAKSLPELWKKLNESKYSSNNYAIPPPEVPIRLGLWTEVELVEYVAVVLQKCETYSVALAEARISRYKPVRVTIYRNNKQIGDVILSSTDIAVLRYKVCNMCKIPPRYAEKMKMLDSYGTEIVETGQLRSGVHIHVESAITR
jgi:hypothetical protein